MPPRKQWKPGNKAEETMAEAHRGVPKARRMEMAITQVIDFNKPVATMAKEFGISRSQLFERIKLEREAMVVIDDTAEKAGLVPREDRQPVIFESNRVPPPEEFDRLYFGGISCYDCGIHHELAPFHKEIWNTITGPAKRTIINTPPGFAKSTTGTIKSSVYEIVKDPNSMTMLVSKSAALAEDFLRAIGQWLTDPSVYENSPRNLIQDFGPFQNPNSGWNAKQIFVAGRTSAEHSPTLQAIGVGGHIYGRRATRILFDDIADVDNQSTPEQVQKMLTWIDKMALNRIGQNTGRATFIGTRVASGDIYSHLQLRKNYNVIKYPCVVDHENQLTLWPEHFPWSAALEKMEEMTPADWQLVYQQVDVPGAGASFPPEMLEKCYDHDRVLGMYDHDWQLVVGIDPAGAGKNSGFTAMVLLGIDPAGGLHLVDMVNVKSMKAPDLKAQLLDWCDMYPVKEVRVEINGLQAQLYQYDLELRQQLNGRGIRLTPHITHKGNKWDPEFGVSMMATPFHNQMFSLPWATNETQQRVNQLVTQLVGFPMADVSDLVMALWFAWLGCREIGRARPATFFSDKHHVPQYVKNRRRVLDQATGLTYNPNDPTMPNFGRGDQSRPRQPVKLFNVGGNALY
jgi:hypothetical protein